MLTTIYNTDLSSPQNEELCWTCLHKPRIIFPLNWGASSVCNRHAHTHSHGQNFSEASTGWTYGFAYEQRKFQRISNSLKSKHMHMFFAVTDPSSYQQDRALKSLPAPPPIINALLRLVRRGFFVDFQTVDVPSRRDNMDVNLPSPPNESRPQTSWTGLG